MQFAYVMHVMLCYVMLYWYVTYVCMWMIEYCMWRVWCMDAMLCYAMLCYAMYVYLLVCVMHVMNVMSAMNVMDATNAITYVCIYIYIYRYNVTQCMHCMDVCMDGMNVLNDIDVMNVLHVCMCQCM